MQQDDQQSFHAGNWFQCMRARPNPNGSLDSGFARAVAVVMATRSYREGRRLYWDRVREEIRDDSPNKPAAVGAGTVPESRT